MRQKKKPMEIQKQKTNDQKPINKKMNNKIKTIIKKIILATMITILITKPTLFIKIHLLIGTGLIIMNEYLLEEKKIHSPYSNNKLITLWELGLINKEKTKWLLKRK